MKYIVLLIAFSFCKIAAAQHCPFDGSYLIAIKVVNKKGENSSPLNIVFNLLEVDNSMADSCTSAVGTINKQLLNTENFIANYNERWGRNGYNKQLEKRFKNAGVFATANNFVTINNGEKNCLFKIKTNDVFNNEKYVARKFVVTYKINKKIFKVKVPQNAIFSLCTASKDLENFKPILIIM